MCAEPSPDALAAISVALAANIDAAQQGSGSASFSTAESVVNIGLRTQTIQLLRDGMYRLCEAYFNSALDGLNMADLQARYQNAMVTLLAIEQLTGAATPVPSVAFAASSAESAPVLNALQKELEKARTTSASASEKVSKLEAELQKLKEDEEGKATVAAANGATQLQKDAAKVATETREAKESELAAAKKTADESATNAASLERQRDSARSLGAFSGSGALVPQASSGASMSAGTAEKVSTAVENIVTVYLREGMLEPCLEFLKNPPSAGAQPAGGAPAPVRERFEKRSDSIEKAVAACAQILSGAGSYTSYPPDPPRLAMVYLHTQVELLTTYTARALEIRAFRSAHALDVRQRDTLKTIT